MSFVSTPRRNRHGVSFLMAVFFRLTWQLRLSENKNFWIGTGKYPQRLLSSGNLSELKIRSSFISVILAISGGADDAADDAAEDCWRGSSSSPAAAATAATAPGASLSFSLTLISSCCFISHSCLRAVWDGLSHCPKQHGTHNPFGCASFFRNPG